MRNTRQPYDSSLVTMMIGVIKFFALLAICLAFMFMQVSDVTNIAFIVCLGYFRCPKRLSTFRRSILPEKYNSESPKFAFLHAIDIEGRVPSVRLAL
jgi:hypothetical protein